MEKIICNGTQCLEGCCPIHGAGYIKFENHWIMRIPTEEMNKDLDTFKKWISDQATFIWLMNSYKDDNGK